MNQPTLPTSDNPVAPPLEPHSNWPFIMRLLGGALGVVVLVYVVWWGFLYTMQDKMLFPTDQLPSPQLQPKFPNTVVMRLKLDNNQTNEAWFIPGQGADNEHPAPLVIFFHGNAELIDFQDQIVAEYNKRGINVLLPEYRGYGRSGGVPGIQTIQDDCEQFYDAVIKLPMVDPTRIVFHGRSIGGAIATHLANTRPPASIILESTFANMAEMAHDHAAPAFLIKHPYKTDRIISKLQRPILIMHGSTDPIIPVQHGHLLQQAAPNATYVEYDAGHNDFPGPTNLAAYWGQIDKLLTETGIDASIKPMPKPGANAAAPMPTPTTQPAVK